MQSVAYWLVLELTHSAFDLRRHGGAPVRSVLLFGTIGGLVADRFDKRRGCSSPRRPSRRRPLCSGCSSPAARAPVDGLGAGLGLRFINVADNPSRQSFGSRWPAPTICQRVALNSVIRQRVADRRPALAGILIASVGLSWAFLVNAVSLAAVTGALYAMPTIRTCTAGAPVGRAKAQIRAGLRYAWQAWELRVPLLMMAVIGTLAYNFSVILPLYAHDVFFVVAAGPTAPDRGHGHRALAVG